MSDTMNAEVVETRESELPKFEERWIVQYFAGNLQRSHVEPSRILLDAWIEELLRPHETSRLRIIRIPAEGEQPQARRPATADEIKAGASAAGGERCNCESRMSELANSSSP